MDDPAHHPDRGADPVRGAAAVVPAGETEASPSAWTIDSAMAHLQMQMDALSTLLDERYATQTKAIDAAFAAQQLAMTTALQAAERAVQVAQASAEKAVLKAEASADKRFEAVNEFRQTLTDQTATFATRESMEAFKDSTAIRFRETMSRLDMAQGKGVGATSLWGFIVGGVGLFGAVLAIAFALRGNQT